MPDKFLNSAGRIFFRLIFFIMIFSAQLFSQTKSNLDIFYSLIDSSVSEVSNQLSSDKAINLDLILPDGLQIFKNRIISKLNEKGYQINSNQNLLVSYIIEDASVSYGDVFRESLFGSFYTTRTISLKGNYLIKEGTNILSKKFQFSESDSVSTEKIKDVENIQYPFTRGELPHEPFFASLWEPVIAIGAAAVTIYLFFTLRSK